MLQILGKLWNIAVVLCHFEWKLQGLQFLTCPRNKVALSQSLVRAPPVVIILLVITYLLVSQPVMI